MSLIAYLTRIHFAERVLDDALGAEIARLGTTRPLLLIDDDGRSGDGASAFEDALPKACAPVWGHDLGIDLSDRTDTDHALRTRTTRLFRWSSPTERPDTRLQRWTIKWGRKRGSLS